VALLLLDSLNFKRKERIQLPLWLSFSTRELEVIHLICDERTTEEIAEELNINVGTSKSNLAKARANMKKILLKELKRRDGKSVE